MAEIEIIGNGRVDGAVAELTENADGSVTAEIRIPGPDPAAG